MKGKGFTENIEIPAGIEVHIDNNMIKVKGQKGELSKKLHRVIAKKEGNKIVLSVPEDSRKSKDILNTNIANINNMLKGANEIYVYKLKVCSGHFPMNVTVDKDKLTVKNFLGEKLPRIAKIIQGVNVKVNGDIITVESNDKDKAGQVSANIEIATRIVYKDRRVFQDGIFLIEKAGVPLK